jgi:hypothetical protein
MIVQMKVVNEFGFLSMFRISSQMFRRAFSCCSLRENCEVVKGRVGGTIMRFPCRFFYFWSDQDLSFDA